MTPKVPATKEQNNMYSLKLKTCAKDVLSNREPMGQVKVSANHIPDKGLISI